MCIFKIAAGRETEIVIDPADFMDKSVAEIDADLGALFSYAAMALGVRQMKATRDDMPAPLLPGSPTEPRVEVVFKRPWLT